jgi:redox-sensitive bicupin YhaK (pirin superfamily)
MPYLTSRKQPISEVNIMTKHQNNVVRAPAGLDVKGLRTHDLTFENFRDAINPFLILSLFDMTGPVFPPHPHGGFSVATYILPESEIGFWNQDTIGTRNAIEPGSLHWTTAGSGLMHEETVSRSGRHALGFQIWIDHAADKRQIKPEGLQLHANDVPMVTGEGFVKRVLVGASGEVASPLKVPTQVRIIDMELRGGATVSENIARGENAFAWVRSGSISIAGQTVGAGHVAFLSDTLVAAAESDARFTLFAAQPIIQDVQPGGPFVGSNSEEIKAFHQRYRNGDMGRLTPFDQATLDRNFDTQTTGLAS